MLIDDFLSLQPLKLDGNVKQQDFSINIFSLKKGNHEFEYEINGEYLKLFNPDLVEDANLEVILDLKKSETMVEANFNIQGTVQLVCDRSLEVYPEEVNTQNRIFFKYGEEAQELSDEIEIIPFNQHEIDISHLIYEFVAIIIPMKKLHPKFQEEEDDEEFESLIYSSKEAQQESEEEQNEDDNKKDIDPRWEALKNIGKN